MYEYEKNFIDEKVIKQIENEKLLELIDKIETRAFKMEREYATIDTPIRVNTMREAAEIIRKELNNVEETE